MFTHILAIIGGIFFFMLIVLGFALLIIGLHYFLFFYWRGCKYCNHTMQYKGLKEDNDDGHYLFYCPKCGAWEQVPRREFYRQCDNPIDNK